MSENNEKKCAYCGKGRDTVQFTKEHVVSHTFLNKYYPPITPSKKINDRNKKKNYQVGGYQNSIQRDSCNYQTIPDVCEKCNNEILSALDEYFLKFYDLNTDCKLKKQGQLFTLKYDYSLLSRWLLKTLYNSERKNAYSDIIPPYLHNFKKYILYNQENTDYELQLYFECLKDHEKLPLNAIYRNSRKNGILKLGNMVIDKAFGYSDIKTKYFISGNYAFYLFFKHKDSLESIDQFISDLNYYRCIELYKIDSTKDFIEYKVSARSIVDIINLTKEGNLWSTDRYKMLHNLM